MDPVGVAVLVAVLVGGAAWSRAVARSRVAARAAVARELGLAYVPGRWLEPECLRGDYEGVPVAIEYFVRSSGKTSVPCTRVRAMGVDPEIRLSGEHLGVKLLQSITGSDLRTGDVAFDEAVAVHGSVKALVGLLDADTRAAVASFVVEGHRVEGGEVVAELQGYVLQRLTIEPLLQQAARIATRLRPGFLSDKALARIAIEDLEPGIRRNALAALRARGAPIATDTHLRARDDWDPTVRIDALLHLRDYAAIETVPSDGIADWAALAPQSVAHVLRHFTSEAALVPLLRYQVFHEIVCARLAAVGGDAAVAALREHVGGILGAGRPARDAIDAIHARLGRSSGSLSLSTTGGGELSEGTEGGTLSESKDIGEK